MMYIESDILLKKVNVKRKLVDDRKSIRMKMLKIFYYYKSISLFVTIIYTIAKKVKYNILKYYFFLKIFFKKILFFITKYNLF